MRISDWSSDVCSSDLMNPGVRGFAPDALQAIDEARWPGNVRELENRIKRAVIMADGKLVMREDLDMAGGGEEGEEAWLNLRSAREGDDRVAIRRAMTPSGGKITRRAKLPGNSRPALHDQGRETGGEGKGG